MIQSLLAIADQTNAFRLKRTAAGATVPTPAGLFRWDHLVTVVPPQGRGLCLKIHARARALPAEVAGILPRMRSAAGDGVPVLYAPSISPRVAELCQAHEVGHFDAVGNCRIVAPGLFVHVSGQEAPPTTRPLANPFSRRSSRISRALLGDPARCWQVQELARETGVSLGLASKVVDVLMREAFVTRRDRQIALLDPEALFRAWSRHYSPDVKRISLYSPGKPEQVEARVTGWCESHHVLHALTQLSGAWRVAPLVRYNQSTVCVEGPVEQSLGSLMAAVRAKRVETGPNLMLWIARDLAVFHGLRQIRDVNVVSPIQLYVDLLALGGRGEEAANEVLSREITPRLEAAREAGAKRKEPA